MRVSKSQRELMMVVRPLKAGECPLEPMTSYRIAASRQPPAALCFVLTIYSINSDYITIRITVFHINTRRPDDTKTVLCNDSVHSV